MRFSNLILDTDKDVAMLTLDRPERLNALSADLLRELIEAAAAVAESDARTVVISGAGRAFCAGVDIETKAAGFLNTVVEPEDVHSSALDLAALISTKPRVPIESMKAPVAEIVSGDTSRDDNLSAVTEFDHPESVAAREPYVARFIGSP